MASGTGNLPNQNMDFTPFDILTAEEMDDLVENIESLADGSGIGDEAIGTSALADGAVTSEKLNPSISTETVGSITYRIYDYGSHKVYKGEFVQTNISAGVESATQAYPSGVQPTTGSQNCIADFSVFSTAGGYPNLYGFAFTCQSTGWKFYSSLAVSTTFRVVVTFTTYA